ncbi:MAG: hypothetical protein FJZ90_06020 [Chloroflexi bacterium]|nr:hypothetical protein [Chloroflexota bacterium]
MHYLRAPDDAYRYFATRFEKSHAVIGLVFRSEQDGHAYTADDEGWICLLEGLDRMRTIDPLPVQGVRRAEVLTGMKWGFRQLHLADHYPLQQTIQNLRQHIPPADIMRCLRGLAGRTDGRIDTWGDGLVAAAVWGQRKAGFEYAVTQEGAVYARVLESLGKFVRTRGQV